MNSKNLPKRIIGKNLTVSADERALSNLNTLIIGSTGAGKTRGYVSPNISAAESESMIVLDSKLNLYNKHKDELERKGYQVELIDLCNLPGSTIGYNPTDFLRMGKNGSPKHDDVAELAGMLCSKDFQDGKDPFWHTAATEYITACIHLCLHILPTEEHTLSYVNKILKLIERPEWNALIEVAESSDPDCFEVEFNKTIASTRVAEKMLASIIGVAQSAMSLYTWDECEELYSREKRINFTDLGERKTTVFVNVPDHDFGKSQIVSLFFSQAVKALLDHADSQPGSRLKVPVHLYADDIGASFCIPHLPELLSITRSRGLSLSLILQNWGQLEAAYGPHQASTIAGNCSTIVYLSSTDIETPRWFSEKTNMPVERILVMHMDTELVCLQGQKPFFAKKHNADDYRPVAFVDEPCLEPITGLERETNDERSDNDGKEAS